MSDQRSILVLDNVEYYEIPYEREIKYEDERKSLQEDVIDNFEHIFNDMIYVPEMPIKPEIGSERKPDFYAIDSKQKKLYVIEVELSKHSLKQHILPQIEGFYDILDEPPSRTDLAQKINRYLKDNKLDKNISDKDVLETLINIFNNFEVVIIIDEITAELEKYFTKPERLYYKPIILQFKKFRREDAGVFIYEMDKLPNNAEVSKANKVLTTNPVKRYDIKDLMEKGSVIYMKYKGRLYTATIESDGIKLENGSLKKTPSGAAKEIMRTNAADGWKVWYQDKECKKPLDLLRGNK